jgi:hypothetical protein
MKQLGYGHFMKAEFFANPQINNESLMNQNPKPNPMQMQPS